jgi:hypothetical protein
MSDGPPITLREYVDMRFEMAERATSAALAAQERAVNKAEVATEKRFESVNEFRATLADSARLLMPRSEAEQSFRVLAEKNDVLAKRLDARDAQGQGLNQGWLILVALISVASSIGMFILTIMRARP